MPRAFCPECGSEVPVDADGVCHVGHLVELGGASVGPGGGTDATFGGQDDDADEPQPWVASVDTTTLGGFTPPPASPDAVPDEEPWTPDAGGGDPGSPEVAAGDAEAPADPAGDELAAAAAAAVESLQSPEGPSDTPDADARSVEVDRGVGPDVAEAHGEDVEAGWPQTLPAEGQGGTPGWTPPTNDPVAPPPVPAPAPADPPAPAEPAASSSGEPADGPGDDDGDFDLDDLAAAVSELGLDDPDPSAPTPPPPSGEPPVETGTAPETDPAPDGPAWEDDLGEPADAGGAPAEPTAESDPVDLSNFTAKGGKARTGGDAGGRKGGLFRRR